MRRQLSATVLLLLVAALSGGASRVRESVKPAAPAASPLTFSTSDARLAAAFSWAKKQALSYVFPAAVTNDPVGDWYEAALPGRSAFCMRDVSHQAAGAQVLGLGAFNRNMLRKFALAIADLTRVLLVLGNR